MRAVKATLIAAMAVIVVACSGGVVIPTFPPIPSIPTIPPIEFPSGETLPPGVLPSADANSGVCLFVTPAEMSSLIGSAATVTDNSGTACTYTFANFSSVVITTDTADLSTARILFGSSAKDTTISGLPAISGVFIGQPAIYIQRDALQLQVMGILTGSDDAMMAKLAQVAQLAVSRWH